MASLGLICFSVKIDIEFGSYQNFFIFFSLNKWIISRWAGWHMPATQEAEAGGSGIPSSGPWVQFLVWEEGINV